MARPKRRQTHDFFWAIFLNASGDRSYDIGIGRERQMRTMLFEGTEWEKDDNPAPLEFFDFRPTQIFQKHSSFNGVGNITKRKMQNARD